MKENKRAVALGIFDGVHLGHRAVLNNTEIGGERSAVFTFENASLKTKQGRAIEYIYTDAQKAAIIRTLGIGEIFSEDFSKLCNMSGEEFVSEILIKRLNTGTAACGRDFRFGRGASCGINELYGLGKKYGFEVRTAEDVILGGETVSSNRIRQLISDGDAENAARLLGSEYCISGSVVHGKQLGRTIDFPTINQLFADDQLIPRFGVYASSVKINGICFDAITNIGVKPTVEGERSPLAETHIIGFESDIYGESPDVEMRRFIRPERKFESLAALREQIKADITAVVSEKNDKFR